MFKICYTVWILIVGGRRLQGLLYVQLHQLCTLQRHSGHTCCCHVFSEKLSFGSSLLCHSPRYMLGDCGTCKWLVMHEEGWPLFDECMNSWSLNRILPFWQVKPCKEVYSVLQSSVQKGSLFCFFLTLLNHFSPSPSSGINYSMPYFQLKLKCTAEDEITKNLSFRKWNFYKRTESIFPLECYLTQSTAGSCGMNRKQSLEERLSYKIEVYLFSQFVRNKNPWNWIPSFLQCDFPSKMLLQKQLHGVPRNCWKIFCSSRKGKYVLKG